MTLPPLPEPAAHLADSLPLYTEAQLLALQAATVEACAKKCESLDELHPAPIRRVFYQCAAAIRSMK